jgi:hypothetical protein
MLGLWDYGDERVGSGKQKPPDFDIVSTANWSGYQAEFEIRDSQLWLREMTGQIGGKARKNEQIIPGERFPIVAKWFSGRIHLPVGGFDPEKQEYAFVIIFHVDGGRVTRTEYAERMTPVHTWNGVPQTHKPHQVTVALFGIGEAKLPPGKWLLERVGIQKSKDVYLYEKDSPRLERLSFQLFKGDKAKPLTKLIDSIGDGVVNGIPRGVLRPGEAEVGASQILLPATNVNESSLAMTSIGTVENGIPWMNHVVVCNWKNGVLVCVHASPHIISPDVVKNVYSDLKESLPE